MTIPKLALHGLDTVQHGRRVAESINDIITHEADDWRRQSDDEKIAGVTPLNRAYPKGDPRRYGAVGDGVTDDRAALVMADLVGPIILARGTTYRVASDLAIESDVQMLGGSIAPDNGAKVTLSGSVQDLSEAPFVGAGFVELETEAHTGRAAKLLPSRAGGVPVRAGGTYFAFGDSYTFGVGAASVPERYSTLFAQRIGATESNHAVSGRGITRAVAEAFENLPPFRAVGQSGDVISCMAGFNDLHYQPTQPKTLVKLENGMKSFLANCFLGSAASGDDASVTRTGSWSNAGPPGVWAEKSGLSLGGAAVYSTVANDEISWTFTGTSLVVGYLQSGTSALYTLSTLDVYIDGVLKETLSPNNVTDGNSVGFAEDYEGLTQAALVYPNLGSGSHTVRIVVKQNSYAMIDYFGTLMPPGRAPSVLVSEIPHVNADGYAGPESGRSKAIDRGGSEALLRAVREFQALGFPVAWVPVNDYYDYQANIATDDDHPGPEGHRQLADAFMAYVQAAHASPTIVTATISKTSAQTIGTGTATDVSWDAVDGEDSFFDVGSPTVISMPSTGTLLLSGTLAYEPDATGVRTLDIHKNGSGGSLRTVLGYAGFATASCDNMASFTVRIPVDVGDFFVLKTAQDSGGDLDITTLCKLDVALVV